MLSKDLKVRTLDITEDNYEFKALFRLCSGDVCLDVDLEKLSDKEQLDEVKRTFSIDEDDKVIVDNIMDKVMEASALESRISEGENLEGEIRTASEQRKIDSLSTS